MNSATGLQQLASRGGEYSERSQTGPDCQHYGGGEIVNEPYEFPGGRRFHFLDPSGNELGVWAQQ